MQATYSKKNMVLNNSYLMLAPHDYSTGTTGLLTVTYTVTSADGVTVTNTSTKTLDENWAAGSAFTYNLTFTLTGVQFSSSVTDWNATGGSIDLL